MQDQLKLLHQKSLQYEQQQARTRANSMQAPATPRSPSTPRRNTQPSSNSHSAVRVLSRQASMSGVSDGSPKDNSYLTSPRIARRSSIDNLSMSSQGRNSQSMPNGHVRRPSGSGSVWTTSDGSPAFPSRHASGSVQSISSQAFWRPGATSDLGSSVHGSTQEITVVAKMIDDGTQGRGITGMNCIRALVSNPFFFFKCKMVPVCRVSNIKVFERAAHNGLGQFELRSRAPVTLISDKTSAERRIERKYHKSETGLV